MNNRIERLQARNPGLTIALRQSMQDMKNRSGRWVTLLLLMAIGCGQQTPLDESGSNRASNSGVDGAPSGSGGTSGSSRDCTNILPDAGANTCSSGLPVPCKPCIACAPLPHGDKSGCAAPDIAIFAWPGGGVDTSLRYPVGCAVFLPTQNPYYPGSPQTCGCHSDLLPPDAGPSWICPI